MSRMGWLQRWRRSVRWRLVSLFVLLAAATAVVFLVGMQRVLQGGWQAYARPLLADYADRLAAEIGSPPDLARAQAIVARLPVSVRIAGPALNWDSRPRPRWSDRFDRFDGLDRYDENEEDGERFGLVRRTADDHVIRFGLAPPQPGARPRWAGWLTLLALLALTALAYAFVRRMFAPLADIGAGAERYGRGQFTPPIPVRRDDELGELAGRINRMADGLHGMLDAKRALLLAISHELRSPLTRARVNAELLPEGPQQAALVRDLALMRDLVADLLESERLQSGHAALQAEPTDLAALVRELVATQFAGQPLTLDLAHDLAPAAVDPARVRLLLRNLIDNALRHGAGAALPPVVTLRGDGPGHVRLSVRDHGPGIAAEHLAQLGEAFYRPDSARTRAAGGVGLGLHLCRLVARAHGGTLELRNAAPGLEAIVKL
ncbi:MAG: HAMP domain-containing histidine kinase [Rubrivivax sp.]|nr:HAMP domain-containing histidine kinase [Rubrivivax sp.]